MSKYILGRDEPTGMKESSLLQLKHGGIVYYSSMDAGSLEECYDELDWVGLNLDLGRNSLVRLLVILGSDYVIR